jgi:hypothetical protein
MRKRPLISIAVLLLLALAAGVAYRWSPVTWDKYKAVAYGMTEKQVISILGNSNEPQGTHKVFLMGYPEGKDVHVRRWWSKWWRGRIDVGFDDEGLVRWKDYDPNDRDPRGDSVRE